MSKDKGAVAVSKATGWKYSDALRFVRYNRRIAIPYADTEGCTVGHALIQMALAEKEINMELDA